MTSQEHGVTVDALTARGLLPDNPLSVYVGGSVVRGWGNELSDIDIYVIVNEPWSSDTVHHKPISLQPKELSQEVIFAEGRRWDLEYWLDGQVDQLLSEVAHDAMDNTDSAGETLGGTELNFLERLPYSIPLVGEDWLARRREELARSAWRAVMTARSLNIVDLYTEDAVGQLRAGDIESAVLSARLALGSAVDALLASHGEIVQNPKWRARKFRAADPTLLDFDRYWQLETMRTFEDAKPEVWIEEVLGTCQRLSTEISIT